MFLRKTVIFIILYFTVGECFLFSQIINDSCSKSITLLCNKSVTYDYPDRSNDIEECDNTINSKQHWFKLSGTGRTLRVKYDISSGSGPPFLFIYSGSCNSLISMDNHFNSTYYLETESGVDYFLRFSSSKIYSDPCKEPGGTFSISAVCFNSDCPDSLNLQNIELKDSIFHALEHLNTDAQIAGQVVLRSGNSIALGENFTIDQNSILECAIADCPNY